MTWFSILKATEWKEEVGRLVEYKEVMDDEQHMWEKTGTTYPTSEYELKDGKPVKKVPDTPPPDSKEEEKPIEVEEGLRPLVDRTKEGESDYEKDEKARAKEAEDARQEERRRQDAIDERVRNYEASPYATYKKPKGVLGTVGSGLAGAAKFGAKQGWKGALSAKKYGSKKWQDYLDAAPEREEKRRQKKEEKRRLKEEQARLDDSIVEDISEEEMPEYVEEGLRPGESVEDAKERITQEVADDMNQQAEERSNARLQERENRLNDAGIQEFMPKETESPQVEVPEVVEDAPEEIERVEAIEALEGSLEDIYAGHKNPDKQKEVEKLRAGVNNSLSTDKEKQAFQAALDNLEGN